MQLIKWGGDKQKNEKKSFAGMESFRSLFPYKKHLINKALKLSAAFL